MQSDDPIVPSYLDLFELNIMLKLEDGQRYIIEGQIGRDYQAIYGVDVQPGSIQNSKSYIDSSRILEVNLVLGSTPFTYVGAVSDDTPIQSGYTILGDLIYNGNSIINFTRDSNFTTKGYSTFLCGNRMISSSGSST